MHVVGAVGLAEEALGMGIGMAIVLLEIQP